MATKAKSKAVSVQADEDVLAQLASAYPQEEGGKGILLPRLGMFSQDKTEETKNSKTGKKEIKIMNEAGTFFIDRQTDEVDKDGKKVWEKEEIGSSIEGIIFYKRHQLRMFDEATEEYTSSPVYDSPDEVIPLFCDKKEVARGTPAELKAKYMYTTKDGKNKSALEDNRIVYVLYEGEPYQMNLRGSSMYSLLTYERSVQAPTVLTEMSSEAMEKGDISWNKMTFRAVRKLTGEEAMKVLELQKNAAEAIAVSKASFAQRDEAEAKFKAIGEGEDDAAKDALKKF